jgi:hypothetical protein
MGLKQKIKIGGVEKLSADEYLERLDDKIIKCLFFYVKIF